MNEGAFAESKSYQLSAGQKLEVNDFKGKNYIVLSLHAK